MIRYRVLLALVILGAVGFVVFSNRIPSPVGGSYAGTSQHRLQEIVNAIAQYHQDTGTYPGQGAAPDANAFPALYEALCGRKPLQGKGGPNAPYIEFKQHDILVWDAGEQEYREAEDEEILNHRVEKFVSDPCGRPYAYRIRARPVPEGGKAERPFLLYSIGIDGIDQTILGEEGDDISPESNVGASPQMVLPWWTQLALFLILASVILGFLHLSYPKGSKGTGDKP